jgi:hypothetical protein
MQSRDSALASATTRVSTIVRGAAAFGSAFLFAAVVALGFSALTLPLLGYFAGYAGIIAGLILYLAVVFCFTAYLTPTLYRKFQKTSAD